MIETRHVGQVASRDGGYYQVRIGLVVDSATDTPVQEWPVKSLTVDTGERGESENKTTYEGELAVEFVTSGQDEPLKDVSQVGDDGATVDFVYADDPDHFGTQYEDTIWKGYVLPDFFSRGIGATPEVTKVSAKTGLKRLEDFAFDPITTAPSLINSEGRMRYIDAIAHCLSPLRDGMSLCSASSLYATLEGSAEMDEYAPLRQLTINPARFYEGVDAFRVYESGEVVDDGIVYYDKDGDRKIVPKSGEPTDRRTALDYLLGDENGEAGLRKLFPSYREGEATWMLVERPLEAEPGGYDQYVYSLSGAGATYEGRDPFDPAKVEGEDFKPFRAESNPAREYRQALGSASVVYEHLEVPNLLESGDFAGWKDATHPTGWQETEAISDYTYKAEPAEDEKQDSLSNYGLVIEEIKGADRTVTLPTQDEFQNRPSWTAATPQLLAGERLRLSARVYANSYEDYSDDQISIPVTVKLEGDSGATYYANGPGVWSKNDATWQAGSWSVKLEAYQEDAFELPPLPEGGAVRIHIAQAYQPYLKETLYDKIRIDVLGEESERLEAKRHRAFVSGGEGEARDEVALALGDGPARVAQGALQAKGAATRYWRFGFDAEPTENGGEGVRLHRYHAESLARQRADARLVRRGRLICSPSEYSLLRFQDVFETGDGERLAPVSMRWYVTEAEVEGEWVEVARAPDVSLFGSSERRSGDTSSLPDANPGARSSSRIKRVTDQLAGYLATRNALTHTTEEVASGDVSTLPVEAQSGEPVLQSGDPIVVIDSATGRPVEAQVTTDVASGDTSINVAARDGTTLTLEEPLESESGVYYGHRDLLRAVRDLQSGLSSHVDARDNPHEVQARQVPLSSSQFDAGEVKSAFESLESDKAEISTLPEVACQYQENEYSPSTNASYYDPKPPVATMRVTFSGWGGVDKDGHVVTEWVDDQNATQTFHTDGGDTYKRTVADASYPEWSEWTEVATQSEIDRLDSEKPSEGTVAEFEGLHIQNSEFPKSDPGIGGDTRIFYDRQERVGAPVLRFWSDIEDRWVDLWHGAIGVAASWIDNNSSLAHGTNVAEALTGLAKRDGDLALHDFEDGLGEWTAQHANVDTSGKGYNGGSALTADTDDTATDYDLATLRIEGRPASIRFRYLENNSSNGGGLFLRDASGIDFLKAGTSNPAYQVESNTESGSISGSTAYNDWVEVRIRLDWEEQTARVQFKELASGEVQETTLGFNANTLSALAFNNANSIGGGSVTIMHLDDVLVRYPGYSDEKVADLLSSGGSAETNGSLDLGKSDAGQGYAEYVRGEGYGARGDLQVRGRDGNWQPVAEGRWPTLGRVSVEGLAGPRRVITDLQASGGDSINFSVAATDAEAAPVYDLEDTRFTTYEDVPWWIDASGVPHNLLSPNLSAAELTYHGSLEGARTVREAIELLVEGEFDFAYSSLVGAPTRLSQFDDDMGVVTTEQKGAARGVATLTAAARVPEKELPERPASEINTADGQELNEALNDINSQLSALRDDVSKLEKRVSSLESKDTTEPARPFGLGADGYDGWVDIYWDGNNDDTQTYNLYRDGRLYREGLTYTYAEDHDVQNGQTYRYEISAVDEAGNESNLSVAVEATPTAS